jgi:hypothetical protein
MFFTGGVCPAASGPCLIGKVFTLKGHTALDCDAASQGFDPFHISFIDGLAMIKDPV